MNREPQLLIPKVWSASLEHSERSDIPSRRLASSLIGFRFLGFLPESSSAVWILFPHRFPVGQILCSVDNHYQRPNLWSIYSHVGENACCVGPAK